MTSAKRGLSTPEKPPTPAMALRTYRFLRIGVVGVIGVLAVSLYREYDRAGDCLQGSISAFYYTPVKSVFVGALVALGFAMIVLWGKTLVEDGLFNLAGLLAPVVAFVPTGETRKCGLKDPLGEPVRTNEQEKELIAASHRNVDNNMYAYLVVVLILLLVLVAIGLIATFWKNWPTITDHKLAYWIPLVAAGVMWSLGFWKFQDREWFYDHAHMRAAIGMFALIVLAILAIALTKLRGNAQVDEEQSVWWAGIYAGLAVLMGIGAWVIYGTADNFDKTWFGHRIFTVEAWMIGGVAIFWMLQTMDRWNDGAPPQTETEQAAKKELVAAQAAAEEPK